MYRLQVKIVDVLRASNLEVLLRNALNRATNLEGGIVDEKEGGGEGKGIEVKCSSNSSTFCTLSQTVPKKPEPKLVDLISTQSIQTAPTILDRFSSPSDPTSPVNNRILPFPEANGILIILEY
jgi:hypothetical protein